MAVATCAGVGWAPIAPGTAGSACALLIFVLFSPGVATLTGLGAALLGILGLLGLGTWAAQQAEACLGRCDDGRIVIDEVVGQLVTLTPLLPALGMAPPVRGAAGLAWVVTGFVVFRVLDVWKPGPVAWAERRFQGGLGVMMDDVLAGLLGAVVLGALLVAWAGLA
jgi:phosphatidylglycerophosphatase A